MSDYTIADFNLAHDMALTDFEVAMGIYDQESEESRLLYVAFDRAFLAGWVAAKTPREVSV